MLHSRHTVVARPHAERHPGSSCSKLDSLDVDASNMQMPRIAVRQVSGPEMGV